MLTCTESMPNSFFYLKNGRVAVLSNPEHPSPPVSEAPLVWIEPRRPVVTSQPPEPLYCHCALSLDMDLLLLPCMKDFSHTEFNFKDYGEGA